MPDEQPLSVACSQRWRETSAEKRELARLDNDLLQEVRQAAEVHRQASRALMTVLSCCEGAAAAKPPQGVPSGKPQSVLCAALLCKSQGCQAHAADTEHEGSQLRSAPAFTSTTRIRKTLRLESQANKQRSATRWSAGPV